MNFQHVFINKKTQLSNLESNSSIRFIDNGDFNDEILGELLSVPEEGVPERLRSVLGFRESLFFAESDINKDTIAEKDLDELLKWRRFDKSGVHAKNTVSINRNAILIHISKELSDFISKIIIVDVDSRDSLVQIKTLINRTSKINSKELQQDMSIINDYASKSAWYLIETLFIPKNKVISRFAEKFSESIEKQLRSKKSSREALNAIRDDIESSLTELIRSYNEICRAYAEAVNRIHFQYLLNQKLKEQKN